MTRRSSSTDRRLPPAGHTGERTLIMMMASPSEALAADLRQEMSEAVPGLDVTLSDAKRMFGWVLGVTARAYLAHASNLPEIPRENRCSHLPPDGQASASETARAWIALTARRLQSRIGDGRRHATIWSFRAGGLQGVAFDISDENGITHPITFIAAGDEELGHDVAFVLDLAEGIHLAGLLADALDASTSIGRTYAVHPAPPDRDEGNDGPGEE